MKKQYIIHVTLITLISLLGLSCNDFLEEEPKSTWGVDNFYSTEAEVEIAIAGIYSVFAKGAIYGEKLIGMTSGTR